MAEIDLTICRLRELLIYNSETGVFTNRVRRNNNGAPADAISGTISYGYVQIRIDGFFYKAHRLAWFHTHGVWPLGEIDHINRVKSDNRIANLRDVSRSKNAQNAVKCRSNNSTGFIGVIPHGKGFRAQIMLNRKTTSLGTFKTPEEASEAYWRAKNHIHAGAVVPETAEIATAVNC